MKNLKIVMLSGLFLATMHQTFSTLNNFGISDIFPTKSDDNAQRPATQHPWQTRNQHDITRNFTFYCKVASLF